MVMKETVLDMDRHLDERIRGVEEAISAQSHCLKGNETNQPSAVSKGSLRQSRWLGPSLDQHPPMASNAQDLCSSLTRFAATCSPGCRCSCHSERKMTSPAIMESILGKLFVGFAGVPLFTPKCNLASCEKRQPPHVSLEYWFPIGVSWSRIIRFRAGNFQNIGLGMQLDTLRRVPDSAPCVHFALNGNIEGLMDLFRRGLASPRDVSDTRGYSVLRWALYGKQWETCKFLMDAGADGDYRPIAAHDNSPRNKAWDFILQGFLPMDAKEALQCLTRDSDWIDEQNFTVLHRIVTGLSMQSLEKAILLYKDDIDATDSLGRTPLTWAAARGDERAVALLLQQGADPNTLDIQWTGPVSYAAERGHAICVRLLLDAGASADPIIPGGIKIGSPLNCAARNSPSSLTLKTLLDFGADAEATGVDGKTPLIHVARTNNAPSALLLLEYNANINAADVTGQTPLTTAITYNSHHVLQLLLDHWYENSTCQLLTGPGLVEVAAKYADAETLRILIGTNHFQLKYDKKYHPFDFVEQLRARFDADNELVAAFQDFISTKQEPEMQGQDERVLESGLLPYSDVAIAEKHMGVGVDTNTEPEDPFVDAEKGYRTVDLLA